VLLTELSVLPVILGLGAVRANLCLFITKFAEKRANPFLFCAVIQKAQDWLLLLH
jgi:hypothetical protein